MLALTERGLKKGAVRPVVGEAPLARLIGNIVCDPNYTQRANSTSGSTRGMLRCKKAWRRARFRAAERRTERRFGMQTQRSGRRHPLERDYASGCLHPSSASHTAEPGLDRPTRA